MSFPSGTAVWGLLACIALTTHIAGSWLDIRDFKVHMEAQNQALSERVLIQEEALNEALRNSAADAAEQIAQIDAVYVDAVNGINRLHDAAAANFAEPVPAVAAVATGPAEEKTHKAPAGNKRMAAKLLKCEAKTLYLARELDIMATHYNTLLSVYNEARRTSEYGRKNP